MRVVCDHSLHARFLGPDSLVLDLGANVGAFAAEMIERFGCRCIAVEPSPELFARIPEHARLAKHHLAIAPHDGPVDFHLSEVPVAGSLAYRPAAHSDTVRVPGRTLEGFIDSLGLAGRIDLVKMDIEGAEVAVLDGCSDRFLASLGQLTVEFHDHVGQVSPADIRQLIARLERLGFRTFRRFLGCYYDTLFLNQRLCPLLPGEDFWYRHIVRNAGGLRRRISRWRSVLQTRVGAA
jgi:FkbM family methyltransferase